MKTIKEIADEIGIKKDTLTKRIKRNPLWTDYVFIKEGTQYINKQGEELIKSRYGQGVDMTMDKVRTMSTLKKCDKIPINPEFEPDINFQAMDNGYSDVPTMSITEIITPYKDYIQSLEKQLSKEKAEKIEILNMNSKLSTALIEQSNKTLFLLEQEQQLTKNAQTLQAVGVLKQPQPSITPDTKEGKPTTHVIKPKSTLVEEASQLITSPIKGRKFLYEICTPEEIEEAKAALREVKEKTTERATKRHRRSRFFAWLLS
ncbi:MAG: hypothetical protein FWC91_09815 [Defluviitaleaceae bacterium]|nr:hypothetical protein [Defluviitaleaceae bacterium]